MRFNPAAAAALAAALMVSTAVKADVVLGNLGPTEAGGVQLTGNAGGAATLAFSFTVGSDPLTSELSQLLVGLASTSGSQVKAELRESVGNAPGGTTVDLGTVTAPTTAAAVAYNSFGQVPLTAGQTYWITLSSPSDFTWSFSDPLALPTEQNTSGWSYGTASQNSGSGWSGLFGPGAASLTAVPEPSTYALAGVGLVAAGLLRRYRKSRRVTA